MLAASALLIFSLDVIDTAAVDIDTASHHDFCLVPYFPQCSVSQEQLLALTAYLSTLPIESVHIQHFELLEMQTFAGFDWVLQCCYSVLAVRPSQLLTRANRSAHP